MGMTEANPSPFAGRRVFLTGHTGFKGSWLSAWLLRLGAEVRGYALAPAAGGVPAGFRPFFDEMGLEGRMDHQIADIRDGAVLKAAVAAFRPEIVIHMAAQPLVRLSYAEPVETYATNVMGTVNLLEACRHSPELRSVVVVSSDKCYENREQIWGYREHDPMGGHDPYSNSKGCTELVTSAWRNSFFPPDRLADHGVVLSSGRAGNVIGGGDWSVDRLVPDAMRAVAGGITLKIRNPGAVRPWQHVLEPLSGYLRLAALGLEGSAQAAQGWNFGPSAAMNLSVREVISQFGDRLGGRLRWEVTPSKGALHEATLLGLDCTAARLRLGWRPQLDAAATVGMTAEWYGADSVEARVAVTESQIAAYEAVLNRGAAPGGWAA